MRALASIQIIKALEPIPDADSIESATVLGWKTVVGKNTFHEGDKCVFFEVDSFLPESPEFEFLRNSSFKKTDHLGNGFRIRTQKLRGVLSQGLAMPLSDLGITGEVGDDVTEALGVQKWEAPEVSSNFGTAISGHPDGVISSDEIRIQTIYDQVIPAFKGVPYYISTKIDGTSISIFMENGEFTVATHNNTLSGDSYLKDYFIRLGVPERLKNYPTLCITGELAGPKIQKNRLGLKNLHWYAFTATDRTTGKRYSLDELIKFCQTLGVDTVPIEERGEDLPNVYPTLDSLLERAKGSYPSGSKKEGIVIRPQQSIKFSDLPQDELSFKVLNNDFLLKEK